MAATQNRTPRSRRTFVIVVLLLHGIVTLWNVPQLGHTGGTSPNGLYAHYLFYTSIPTIFLAPFVPESLRSSDVLAICLLSNGVFAAWLVAIGLHHFMFRTQTNSEQSHAPKPPPVRY
jgi:hypothetical protein